MDYTLGRAKDENIIKGEKYRITVLSEGLLRLEYNSKGVFYDAPSQFALDRSFDVVPMELKQDDKFLEIKTKYFTLTYVKEKNFDAGKVLPMANLKVDVNGMDGTWYVNHAEVKNMNGLFISEDGSSNNQKFQKGLYSLDGFASFNDSNSFIYNEDGMLVNRDDTYLDIYLFVYGKEINNAFKDYYKLTGYPPLVPRYVLGNWWSRELPYTTDKILEVANKFEKNDIPLSVMLLEKDWHIRKIGSTDLETGYTFNKDLIPDSSLLIKQLHDKNVRLGLSINPKGGVMPHEEEYQKIREAFNFEDGKIIQFDPLNQTSTKIIEGYMMVPLINKGVDFFYNDYQEFDNVQKLWFLNDSMFKMLDVDSRRGVLLTRNSLLASHRYPVTYTGRTLIGWDSLRRVPLDNQNAANIGVSFVSQDISGNHGGIEEEDLYIRSVQLGCFSPILRFSSPSGKYYRKEPWRWNVRASEVVGDYLRLRHSLLPYLYTEAYDYHLGTPIVRPLYYDEEFVIDDKDYKNEYFFGKSFLVCPILDRKDNLINRTIHRFYIPEGVWYDFKTGKKFPGKKEYISFFKEEDYPVFVRSGAIIPLTSDEGNSCGNPENLEIHVFPGKSNNYTMYEDDGMTKAYKDGSFLKTSLDYNYMPNNYTLIIRSVDGKAGIVPEYRNYKIRFRNTKRATDVVVYFNNSMIDATSYVDDADFVVELNHIPSIGQLTINCKGNDIEIDAIRLINDDIDSILLDLQINTVLKEKISAIMFSNLAIKRKRIEIRKLDKLGLTKEHIKLFLKLLEYIEQI